MSKTTVVNVQYEPYDAYIGRPSAFGNPFKKDQSTTRSQAVALFREYWYAPEQKSLRERAINELKGKRLGCFCKPKACHGDVIAEYLNQLDNDLTRFLECE